jgi:hypothetical protein
MDSVNGESAQALLEKAEAYRRLALEILDGPFRRELVDLANDYTRRAASIQAQIERSTAAHCPAEPLSSSKALPQLRGQLQCHPSGLRPLTGEVLRSKWRRRSAGEG